jgi:hypothetical protein
VPVWRLQTSWAMDSALPRDRLVITPHVDDHGALTDPQGLCDDLVAALQGWMNSTGEVAVRAYDAEGTVPVFPAATSVVNSGAFMSRDVPRELALCLSFYSERNLPRRRGRLYLPLPLIGTAMSKRPNIGHIEAATSLAAILQNLGGPDVDWVVYSRRDQVARPVTNWWVDDEWDVQRSRGLRSTSRTAGTTSEA